MADESLTNGHTTHCYCSKNTAGQTVCCLCGKPKMPFVPIPEYHRQAAERFKLFFVPVPLTEAEKLPDPDYGF